MSVYVVVFVGLQNISAEILPVRLAHLIVAQFTTSEWEILRLGLTLKNSISKSD